MKIMMNYTLLIASGLFALPLYGQSKIESMVKSEVKQINANKTSQDKIDEVSDLQKEKLAKYKAVLTETDNLKSYNAQMAAMIASQKSEMKLIATQIDEIQSTSKELIPLMTKMVATLKQFVTMDTPFLSKERDDRLNELEMMLSRADVSTSEKFRRILEAYQIEVEYGQTIEAYKDSILVGGAKKTVDLLRLGRVALYYVSLDGKEAFKWSNSKKDWITLDAAAAFDIAAAIKVAKKESAPSLLQLPVAKAEVL